MNLSLLRRSATAWHRLIAKNHALTGLYFTLVSAVSRRLLHAKASAQLSNLLLRHGIQWPPIQFAARRVIVGLDTEILLVPHLGEFDEEALFSRRLSYEQPVFRWLEREATGAYDLVLEIGANVGIYSVFLARLIETREGGRLKRIIAFEPALDPFRRLLANLRANGSHCVEPFRAAVADGGFRAFYEPREHLTNGSLLADFAGLFSSEVAETTVYAIAPADLSFFFAGDAKVLLKIDVEGYEAQLLSGLSGIIGEHHPDIVVEVLAGTADALEQTGSLAGYDRYLIADRGLEKQPRLFAHPTHRDWLLRWPAARVGRG